MPLSALRHADHLSFSRLSPFPKREIIMTDTAFRPTLYLLDPCPFCFKVRVFLMEAGLTEKVEIRSFGQGEEMEAVRAELAPHLSKISFPAAELEPGRDRKSTRLNSSHSCATRMPSSA